MDNGLFCRDGLVHTWYNGTLYHWHTSDISSYCRLAPPHQVHTTNIPYLDDRLCGITFCAAYDRLWSEFLHRVIEV